MSSWYGIVWVGLGGGAGSICRYVLASWVDGRIKSVFPFGTYIVNALGCLLIGVLYAFSARYANDSTFWRMLLITGFCGGFTTFSTFSADNILLLQSQQYTMALTNIFLSIISGLLFVWLGIKISH